MKKKQHSFSRNARDFGYLARVFGLDEETAKQAWRFANDEDEIAADPLWLKSYAKNKVLEYEEIIRKKACETSYVYAYNEACIARRYCKELKSPMFLQSYILFKSGRILPKLVALNIL